MSGLVKIRNLSRRDQSCIQAQTCDSFFCRLKGLMFRKELTADEGLLLVQARESVVDTSIHMLFMRMDLAVVWIDSSLRVVDAIVARRWRLAYFPRRAARYVLEMDSVNYDRFQEGEQLAFEDEHKS